MKTPKVLLRSSWQTVNIGDIGHTPGMLRALEILWPEAELTLWPGKVDRGVDKMLMAAFPKLRIAEGGIGADGKPDTGALRKAVAESDFLLHGSGPRIVAEDHVRAFHKTTGKPYGFLGVTAEHMNEGLRALLDGASFIYLRDSVSEKFLKKEKIRCPVIAFGPDATFSIHLRDEERALSFLKKNGLEEGNFICAIPRLRYTPYYLIHNTPPTERELERDKVNETFRDADLGKLREAMILWVRKTGQKILACPEMSYEMELAKKYLIEPLPSDVKPFVVWREEYWRPDEAASVYARAAALASIELHSPIIAIANGVPAIYIRQPTDTCKGQMWRDVGLSDWIFEIDEAKGEDIGRALLGIHQDPKGARDKVRKAQAFVLERER
ncbi:MAG: polysaccharide pyruvyl transferase family protein, partial [Spirochaetia bacterium]|nr:polysaccharide pyruvyl transferase family protein [Spirochaetia bacterium]